MRAGKISMGLVGLLTLAAGCQAPEPPLEEKPVLYLYPEQPTHISVDLEFAGQVTISYPQAAASGPEWTVTAEPTGTLTDAQGRQYPYLFWEGPAPGRLQQDSGFLVARAEVVPFLEDKLSLLGLTDQEAADFITYWAPRLAQNDYSLVTFATDQHSQLARYSFTAAGQPVQPETFVRVYLVYSAATKDTAVPVQQLTPAPPRTGFTVVEWGGQEQ